MASTEASIHVRARYDGQALILVEPVDLPEGVIIDLWAEPVKTEEAKPRRKPGSAKGLIKVREGFDDPLDDFAEYR